MIKKHLKNFLIAFVLLSSITTIIVAASLEIGDTNTNANNNKIVDNPSTITNEYLRFLYDDKTLSNEHLLLKKDEDKKPKVEKEKTESIATDEMSNNITQRINKAYKQSDGDEFDAGVKIKKEQNESEENK